MNGHRQAGINKREPDSMIRHNPFAHFSAASPTAQIACACTFHLVARCCPHFLSPAAIKQFEIKGIDYDLESESRRKEN